MARNQVRLDIERREPFAGGNTIAGLRYPDIAAPLGTYNGWPLRRAGFAEGEQWWNTGSFVLFARTKAEREARGDPRPSIEERVCEGLMLQEDAERFIAVARQKNPLDASVRLGPLIQAGAYSGR